MYLELKDILQKNPKIQKGRDLYAYDFFDDDEMLLIEQITSYDFSVIARFAREQSVAFLTKDYRPSTDIRILKRVLDGCPKELEEIMFCPEENPLEKLLTLYHEKDVGDFSEYIKKDRSLKNTFIRNILQFDRSIEKREFLYKVNKEKTPDLTFHFLKEDLDNLVHVNKENENKAVFIYKDIGKIVSTERQIKEHYDFVRNKIETLIEEHLQNSSKKDSSAIQKKPDVSPEMIDEYIDMAMPSHFVIAVNLVLDEVNSLKQSLPSGFITRALDNEKLYRISTVRKNRKNKAKKRDTLILNILQSSLFLSGVNLTIFKDIKDLTETASNIKDHIKDTAEIAEGFSVYFGRKSSDNEGIITGDFIDTFFKSEEPLANDFITKFMDYKEYSNSVEMIGFGFVNSAENVRTIASLVKREIIGKFSSKIEGNKFDENYITEQLIKYGKDSGDEFNRVLFKLKISNKS